MFKKRKEADEKTVQEWLDLQDTTITKVEEEFAAIDALTDPSEKIVRLQVLESSFYGEQNAAGNKIDKFVKSKTNKREWMGFSGATVGTAAAIGIPAAIFAPPLLALLPFAIIGGLFGSCVPRAKLTPEQKEKQDAFIEKMEGFVERAQTDIKETARTADLKAVAASPFFSEAYAGCKPLCERFAAVAAAKAALDDVTPAAPAAKHAAKDPQAETPAAPQHRDVTDWTKYKGL